jgi:hypothetical protein
VTTDTAARIIGPVQLANADALLYAVPAATTLIIKQIRIVNTTGGTVSFRLSIGADADGTRIAHDIDVPTKGMYLEGSDCFEVLGAGETIRGHAGAAASLTITVNGVLTA